MGRPSSIILVTEHYKKEVDCYQNHLLILGRKGRSVRIRRLYLHEFFSFCEQRSISDLRRITAPHIDAYYTYLQNRPNKRDGGVLRMRTISYHMRTVQLFFAWALEHNKIKTNPASTFILPHLERSEERTVLTCREIQLLYTHCKTDRERVILSLAYGCGLRAGELSAVNIEDVRTRDRILIVPKGKMNKRRVIPLSDSVAEDLEHYFYNERTKRNLREKAFILHGKGGRMMPYTFNKILQKIITRTENKKLEQKKIGIHNLRHSIATHLLEQGLPIEQVQHFLGHAQLETTQIYTRVTQKQINSLLQP